MTFTYGLEFEVERISPRDASYALNQGGIPCERPDSDIHETSELWKAVYDGSLTNGAEVVSPILTSSRLNEAHKVAQILTKAGATAKSKSTGFHIHLGYNAFEGEGVDQLENLSKFIINYYSIHHAIGALVAPSRLNNRYCQILGQVEANAEAHHISNGNLSSRFGSRYYSLNLESIRRHGTVEVRLHQGTLNGVKAIAWAQFVASLITATKCGADFQSIEGITPWAPVTRGRGTRDLTACGLLIDYLVGTGHLAPSNGDWLKTRAMRLKGN